MRAWTLLAIFFAGAVLPAVCAQDEEISLFNSHGKAQAHVDTKDDLTVYLWTGTPVAYLEKSGLDVNVWGFNGKHLGWMADGIVYDHEGYAVAAIKERFASGTQIEELKSLKELKPLKALQELPPLKRIFRKQWSEDWSTRSFLSQGRAD